MLKGDTKASKKRDRKLTKNISGESVGVSPAGEDRNIVRETKKQRILREHNYIESDIPVNSPYWHMRE